MGNPDPETIYTGLKPLVLPGYAVLWTEESHGLTVTNSSGFSYAVL